VPAASRPCPPFPPRCSMVRRGSTVRVRQRALKDLQIMIFVVCAESRVRRGSPRQRRGTGFAGHSRPSVLRFETARPLGVAHRSHVAGGGVSQRRLGTVSAVSHLRAPDGSVLCEHEDTHDDLQALIEQPATVEPERHGHEHDGGHDHSHGWSIARSSVRARGSALPARPRPWCRARSSRSSLIRRTRAA
jgi:hypothetical protein